MLISVGFILLTAMIQHTNESLTKVTSDAGVKNLLNHLIVRLKPANFT